MSQAEASTHLAASSTAAAPPAEAAFRSWPLVDEPQASFLPALLIAAATLAGWTTLGDRLAALIPAALTIAGLWRWYTPVHFHLHAQGVDYRVFGLRRRVRWRDVNGRRLCSQGILLTRDRGASLWLTPLGLFVPYGSHQAAIWTLIRYYRRGLLPAADSAPN